MNNEHCENDNLENDFVCDDFNLKLEFPPIVLLSRNQIIEFIQNEKSL